MKSRVMALRQKMNLPVPVTVEEVESEDLNPEQKHDEAADEEKEYRNGQYTMDVNESFGTASPQLHSKKDLSSSGVQSLEKKVAKGIKLYSSPQQERDLEKFEKQLTSSGSRIKRPESSQSIERENERLKRVTAEFDQSEARLRQYYSLRS